MTNEEILKVFEESKGILRGHFKLTSGRHSGQYMQCAKLFVDPVHSEQLCAELAKKLSDKSFNLVVSPAMGGIIMGYEMARQLKSRNVFAERENGAMTLRRGFELPQDARVLVVEDVVTTGGSVKEVISLMESMGATVVGVASIVDRSNGKVDFGKPYTSLLSMDIPSYEPEACPICNETDLPLIKPGSRV